MRCVRQASVRAALTVAFASSGWYSGALAQDPRSALDPITSAVMKHPITTSSATAETISSGASGSSISPGSSTRTRTSSRPWRQT